MVMLLPIILSGSAALYTLSAIVHLYGMFRRGFEFVARWSTRSAFALQTVGLAVLVYVTGRAPVYTLFEFAYFFSWVLMMNYTVIELIRDNQAAGSFLMPVIAVLQVAAVALFHTTPEEAVPHSLPVSLIGWHVAVTLLGYALLTASFVAGALYLLQERNLRLKRWGPLYYQLPSLETLDIWGGRFVYVGFPLLTIGMISGLSFAQVSWATIWESKVIFTVLIWLIYGCYVLMRKIWGWGGRKAAWWSVAGVACLLFNYFVVNLFSRLHRFGV